jgi:histidyl-tRNA synthetase
VIRLNHRRLLSALLDAASIPAEKHNDALVSIDKLDKIGRDGVVADLGGRGIEGAAAGRLLASFAMRGSEALAALEPTVSGRDAGFAAIRELERIVQLAASTPAAARLQIDPSLARGLSYYTGAIMEIAVAGIGSLGGGGRYDNLVGMFLGRDVPACGFSLGLERIIVVMTERNMFPASVAVGTVDVVVTCMDDESRSEALRFASELRARGLRVDMFPEASRKFDKPLKYASARGARVMGIVGENERTRGEISIRNLETREQQTIACGRAADAVSELLTPSSVAP